MRLLRNRCDQTICISTGPSSAGLDAEGLEGQSRAFAITAEAFDAIVATLPLGTVGYEAERTEKGPHLNRPRVADRLSAMRGEGESYSDVIIRLAAAER